MNYKIALYIITATITSSAFYLFSEFLSMYNFGFTYSLFSVLTFLTLTYFYLPAQAVVFKNIKDVNYDKEKMTIKTALLRQGGNLLFLSFLSAASFGLMLPVLTTPEFAFVFIIFNLISKAVQVPLSGLFFGDEIRKKINYWIGLMLSLLFSGIYFSFGLSEINLSYSVIGLGIMKMVIDCASSLFSRYVTSEEVSENYVPVRTAGQIKSLGESFLALLIGVYILMYKPNTLNPIHEIDLNGMIAILVLGIVIPLSYTMTTRIINSIKHAASRGADGLVLVFAYPLKLLFEHASDTPLSLDKLMIEILCIIGLVLSSKLALKSCN